MLCTLLASCLAYASIQASNLKYMQAYKIFLEQLPNYLVSQYVLNDEKNLLMKMSIIYANKPFLNLNIRFL